MKKIALVSAFVLSQVLTVSAFAQTAAPATRAEVKAETKEAVKAGKTVEGQAAAAEAKGAAKPMSDKAARAEVKADTKAAVKSGAVTEGQAAAAEAKGASKPKSSKTRAETKAETKDAMKKGEIAVGESAKK